MHKPPVSRIRLPEPQQNERERVAEEGQAAAAAWLEIYVQGFWHGYVSAKKDKPDA